jgi:predicted GIY-YIG superfamily endonuclease
MKYYLYFIKIDDEVIKFGITKNIFLRATRHYTKFGRDLGLSEYFEIIKVYEFVNKNVNILIESRLKQFIKLNNKKFVKYNETELILITHYDEFETKVEKLLLNVIDDNEIYDCKYKILTQNELTDVYSYCVNKVPKKKNNKLLSNIYKCDCCKFYKYGYNLFLHRKDCKQYNKQNNQLYQIIIKNTMTLNAFGNEIMPNNDQIMTIIKDTLLSYKVEELLNEFFKLIYINTPKNRNLYLSNINDDNIYIFNISNKWTLVPINNIKDTLLNYVKNNLHKIITSIINENKNKDIARMYIMHNASINDNIRFQNMKTILVENKELLEESKKASENATNNI